MDTNEFFNLRQAARWLGVAVRTLEGWRAAGRGPHFHQFGRSIRYRVGDEARTYVRGRAPDPGDEPMSPEPTWVEIPVGRAQQKILRPVLHWIRKHERLQAWNAALQLCCGRTLDYILSPSWLRIVIPTEGPTRPFRYRRDPHPLDTTDNAIGIATEAIGLDEGAALAHIAATFVLTWPGMAASKDRKLRALRARLLALHEKAATEQMGKAS